MDSKDNPEDYTYTFENYTFEQLFIAIIEYAVRQGIDTEKLCRVISTMADRMDDELTWTTSVSYNKSFIEKKRRRYPFLISAVQEFLNQARQMGLFEQTNWCLYTFFVYPIIEKISKTESTEEQLKIIEPLYRVFQILIGLNQGGTLMDYVQEHGTKVLHFWRNRSRILSGEALEEKGQDPDTLEESEMGEIVDEIYLKHILEQLQRKILEMYSLKPVASRRLSRLYRRTDVFPEKISEGMMFQMERPFIEVDRFNADLELLLTQIVELYTSGRTVSFEQFIAGQTKPDVYRLYSQLRRERDYVDTAVQQQFDTLIDVDIQKIFELIREVVMFEDVSFEIFMQNPFEYVSDQEFIRLFRQHRDNPRVIQRIHEHFRQIHRIFEEEFLDKVEIFVPFGLSDDGIPLEDRNAREYIKLVRRNPDFAIEAQNALRQAEEELIENFILVVSDLTQRFPTLTFDEFIHSRNMDRIFQEIQSESIDFRLSNAYSLVDRMRVWNPTMQFTPRVRARLEQAIRMFRH
jgi:hypothetical protein